ncbi:MAG: hypothetical protein U1E45_14855 [Geminicoccaceae bacterium]
MRAARKRSGPSSALPTKEARNGPEAPAGLRPTLREAWCVPLHIVLGLDLPGFPQDPDEFLRWCCELFTICDDEDGYLWLDLREVMALLPLEAATSAFNRVTRLNPLFAVELCRADPKIAKLLAPYVKRVRPAAERRGPGGGRRLRGY